MLRIKLYLGSKSVENYLNRKSSKGFILDTITSFGLFVPLRLDAYHFTKKEHTNRIYQIDSRKVKKSDFDEYKHMFLDDGWEYFKGNYVNDEYNSDHIFYSDNPSKTKIFSDLESEKQRNRDNAAYSLYKGIFLFMVFLFFSIIFPAPFAGSSNTIIGFILHNLYIIVAILIIVISIIRYIRNKV